MTTCDDKFYEAYKYFVKILSSTPLDDKGTRKLTKDCSSQMNKLLLISYIVQ